jgi:drug/metabolite transporter (DMT)-like permease
MSPLLTLVLGYIILKENVNRSDVMQVLGSIAAIVLIFFSMLQDRKELDSKKIEDDKLIQDDSAEYARRDHFTIIIFILLLSQLL